MTMIGQSVSHYRVIEEIGQGGMGVVYRAEDTQLGRPVALKFLHEHILNDPDGRLRFIREARLAAAINHPNVCDVFDIDECDNRIFIVMRLVEGKPLKTEIDSGPLAIADAIDITRQLCEGLKAAHAKGIIHRDIKSGNVIITPDRRAVITDFGLAKIPGDTEISDVRTAIGSTAYMSPEQLRAEPIDQRTDIWSLGVLLYEMLTGKLPFPGDFDAAVIYAILNEEPVPIARLRADVPADLVRINHSMLAKEPTYRYDKVEHVLEALRRIGTEVASPEPDSTPSIAVLPFIDMSREKDQEYFCDGIAEEITNALAKIGGLRVVARTSAFTFKGKSVSVPEIGRRLGIDAVVEGSVRKSGKRMRVTAQLTDASQGYELWSERYDRDMEDIFAVQDDITLAVVDKLKGALLGGDREVLVKRYTVDAEAITDYWRGRFFWNKRTEEGYKKALKYFQQAIDHDPAFALAYVGIADCYDLLGWYDLMAPEEAFPKAKAAARQAVEMDETLAEAHATAGWVCVNYDWDWHCAWASYERALALNPDYASVHQWYGEYLSYMGKHDEAIEHSRRAVELDPLSLIINTDLGQVYYYARRYDLAIQQLRKTLEMDPDFAVAHFFLSFAHAENGDLDSATEAAMQTLKHGAAPDLLYASQVATMRARAGRADEARRMLAEIEGRAGTRYVSPFAKALIYTALDETDLAFDYLERAFTARDHWMETVKVHPALDPLRDDARFESLLARMNLR